MVRNLLALALTFEALCTDCRAQPVLESPAPAQLAFAAAELDVYAEHTYRERIAVEENGGRMGCARHCERLTRIFAQLVRAAATVIDGPPLQWQLAVGSNPRETAWALAGGRLYISESFIDEFKLSDAELAFVLAHEMSHALLQHENEALTVAAALVPRAVSRTVDSMVGELDFDLGLSLKLGPEWLAEEFEADRAGLLLAGAAGFDPDQMLEFFRKLSGHDAQSTSLIRTHPAASERLQRALAVKSSAQVLRARSQAAAGLR